MNIQEVLLKAYNILKNEDIDTYMIDSQLLLCKVLKRDKMFIMINKDYKLSEEEENQFFSLVTLRKGKMPVKYILNKCEFMGIDFYIEEGVLIPRPDTEILVEWSIEVIKNNKLKNVCDLCCGSGVIGLSVASYCEDVNVSLYDISETALRVTEKNIKGLELEERTKVYYSDLLQRAKEDDRKFDILLSNPPYIAKKEMETLMEDVKNYEPHLALCGGEDGLDFYIKIIENSKQVLSEHAYIGFEIGYDQGKSVSQLLKKEGFENVKILKDLSGLDRVVVGEL